MASDIPVPADYNGDGKTEIAIFRPSNGLWAVKDLGYWVHGMNGDIPVPGDYNGDGTTDIAVYPACGSSTIKAGWVMAWLVTNQCPVITTGMDTLKWPSSGPRMACGPSTG
jgi:hypothetical protein